jgi:hypothetical protein
VAFTVGWPDGNSGISVEYADAYFADRGIPAWAGEESVKQGALVRATDYVKALFAERFDPDIFAAAAPDVPEALAKALCEYALLELGKPGALTPAPAIDASGFSVVTTKRKVGPLERNFAAVGTVDGGPRTRRIFPLPDSLIASLLLPSVGYTRTTR